MGTIYAVDGDDLTAIANKIRTKGGTSASLEFPDGFKDAVDAIQTGITPTGTKNINTNGTHDVTNYASANVAVPASAVDSGTKNINSNGTHDVIGYASADVNVPNTYSQSDEGKVVSNGALVAQTSDTCTTNGVVDTTLINSLDVNVSGGGGQPITLLASGTYTKTNASSVNARVDIPVSFTGTPVQACVYAPTPLSGTAQTCRWITQFRVEQEAATELGISSFGYAYYRTANGTTYTKVAGEMSFQSSNTVLKASQANSSYHVQDNTYSWYIWGYTT